MARIEGVYVRPSAVDTIVGYSLLALMFLPWAALGGGMIAVALLTLNRNDRGLFVLLPAGAMVLLAPILVPLWVRLRQAPSILEFGYEPGQLSYRVRNQRLPYKVAVESITRIRPVYARRGRRTGYLLQFGDGTSAFLSKRVTQADELHEALQAERGASEDW